MPNEIRNIPTTKTNADVLDTDWIEGQTAAGGALSSFKIAKSELTTKTAAQIPFTPAGNLSSTDVQAMGEELDTKTANGKEAADTTGTVIAFATPQTYGSVASPETGNITLNATGLVKGMVQFLLHNHSSSPTFGSEFKRIGGVYVTNQLNSIYFHAVSATRIEYTINQTL